MPGWLNKSPCQCRCSRWLLKHCRVLHSGLKLLQGTLPKRGVQILSVWQLMRCACAMSACPSVCQEMKAKATAADVPSPDAPVSACSASHRWGCARAGHGVGACHHPKPLSLYLHRSELARPGACTPQAVPIVVPAVPQSHRLRHQEALLPLDVQDFICRPKLAKMWAAVLQHRCHAMVLRSTSFCLTLAMTLIFLSLLQQWLHKRSSQQHR